MNSISRLANARSLLFVPGNRPERFEKAIKSGADAVVLDLEDSVPAADKQFALRNIADVWERLNQQPIPIVVRINAIGDGQLGTNDLKWLATLAPLAGVMVPKVESSETLDAACGKLPTVPLLPLIESAAGYLSIRSIAAHSQVLRLAVGHIDFMADTGVQCSEDERELDPLRFEVAMVSRVCRLAPAIDGVTAAIQNDELVCKDARRASRFGFGGKLCIHPRQVGPVHSAFAPTEEELHWANRVIAADTASGGATVQLDGRMVDLPVVLRARAVLERAGR